LEDFSETGFGWRWITAGSAAVFAYSLRTFPSPAALLEIKVGYYQFFALNCFGR
jgi:hypothetical protein